MVKYRAYNILYYKGKPVSKKGGFATGIGKSKEKLKQEVNKENARWNKLKMNRGYKVKLFRIKKSK